MIIRMTIAMKYILYDQKNIFFTVKLNTTNQKKAFYCEFIIEIALPNVFFF